MDINDIYAILQEMADKVNTIYNIVSSTSDGG